MAITDPIKNDAKSAMITLIQSGKRVILLNGDYIYTVKVIANELSEQKQEHIIALQDEGKAVAMVGDGINDVLSLVRVDIGIAIGDGIEVAMDSADLIFLSGYLSVLADTFALARASMRNIKLNLFGAFIHNSLGIQIAAGVLLPLTGLLLSPVITGGSMDLWSLTVVINANQLRYVKLSAKS